MHVGSALNKYVYISNVFKNNNWDINPLNEPPMTAIASESALNSYALGVATTLLNKI